MIVNVDGYISELPYEAATLEFRSGSNGVAGTLVIRDAQGEKLPMRSIAAEFNLPQRPWWARIKEIAA